MRRRSWLFNYLINRNRCTSDKTSIRLLLGQWLISANPGASASHLRGVEVPASHRVRKCISLSTLLTSKQPPNQCKRLGPVNEYILRKTEYHFWANILFLACLISYTDTSRAILGRDFMAQLRPNMAKQSYNMRVTKLGLLDRTLFQELQQFSHSAAFQYADS